MGSIEKKLFSLKLKISDFKIAWISYIYNAQRNLMILKSMEMTAFLWDHINVTYMNK